MVQLMSVLIIIISILLIVIIMVQNPKGGGLSSTFGGGGSQLFGGARKAGDVLDKTTWGLAITLCALALTMNLSLFQPGEAEEGSSVIDRASGAPAQTQEAPGMLQQPQEVEGDMLDILDEE